MTDEFKFDTSQITTLDERFGKCPYATAQSLISGKWAPPILLYLSDGPIRFNELQRRMPKITALCQLVWVKKFYTCNREGLSCSLSSLIPFI
ncbi:winged helix-turn-helix transcriptional regulator, partial [Turicibacter bilis]|uniref:winged helix-turn-helix transcriptional regulator n=1 Tax=Turicibacter bilis TaxID=2735723 RepID=UPI0031B9DBF5